LPEPIASARPAKARVFRQAAGLQQGDAARLPAALLEAAPAGEAVAVATETLGNPLAARRDHRATPEEGRGKPNMDRANRPGPAAARDMLGAVMNAKCIRNEAPSLLDVVALLTDLPEHSIARGQVGTVVERLDDKTLLVEFSDDQACVCRRALPEG